MEHRAAPRYAVACPVEFDGGIGRSKNISVSGILFSTDRPLERDCEVALTLSPEHSPRVQCRARVVRTCQVEGRFDVAAYFTQLSVGSAAPTLN